MKLTLGADIEQWKEDRKKTTLRCQDCQDSQDKPPPARDSHVHCLVCTAWTHLREDLDLTDVRCVEDMVSFFIGDES